MHTLEIEARTVAAQPTVVRRAVVPVEHLTEWIATTLCELADDLRCRDVVPVGFPFARHHPELDGRLAVEAGFPVSTPSACAGLGIRSQLPAGPVATARYAGPYEEVIVARSNILDWLRRHGEGPSGDAWEIYHAPPIGHPDSWHVELVQPFRLTYPLPHTPGSCLDILPP